MCIRDRDFTLAWYKVCWPWMALYNSILPCVALFTLPIGAYLVLVGYSTLPDFALVLCMSFGVGAPLLRALGFMSTLPQINYTITALEQLMGAPADVYKSQGVSGAMKTSAIRRYPAAAAQSSRASAWAESSFKTRSQEGKSVISPPRAWISAGSPWFHMTTRLSWKSKSGWSLK